MNPLMTCQKWAEQQRLVKEAAWEMTTWELPLPPMLLMSAPARVCKVIKELACVWKEDTTINMIMIIL